MSWWINAGAALGAALTIGGLVAWCRATLADLRDEL